MKLEFYSIVSFTYSIGDHFLKRCVSISFVLFVADIVYFLLFTI